MKKGLLIPAVLILSAGVLSAANQVNAFIENTTRPGADTLWADTFSRLVVQLENDVKLGGLSIGFVLSSPDGVDITYNPQGTADNSTIYAPAGFPDSGIMTIDGRMAPGNAVWDLGNFQFTPRSLDGALPDSMLVGGAALSGGFMAGGFEDHVSLWFTLGGVGPDDTKTICVDSSFIPPAGSFLFIDEFAVSIEPGYVPGGEVCYPVIVPLNLPPEITNCPGTAINVNHCASGSFDYNAQDFEGDPFQYELVGTTGSGSANIDPSTGVVNYTPAPGEIGIVELTVQACDAFGCGDICVIQFNITNNAPTIDCGNPVYTVADGNIITNDDISGSDIDACDNLTYHLVDITPMPFDPGSFSIDAATGEFTWQTVVQDMGIHTVTVEVTDGIDASQCTFDVDVIGIEQFEVKIEKVHGQLQGHYAELSLIKNLGSEPFAGFDFLIGYDPTALSFSSAVLGAELQALGWEYFTYRYNYNGNCGLACPSGLLRLVAIADINNGPYHPDGYILSPGEALATMTFLVTNDRTFECLYIPVRFYWFDCGDNTMSSRYGDTLFVSRYVYNYYGDDGEDSYVNVTADDPFPTYYGAQEECLEGDKKKPLRFIDFLNGGFDFICSDEIDARGDINVNGVVYEIADAVMYSNFFINGISAFNDHVEASIAASDANADGLILSVADLVYMVRVIVGDALPYPKPIPGALAELTSSQADGNLVVDFTSDAVLGGALLTFDINGTVGEPSLPSMDVKYSIEDNKLRVLVYSLEGAAFPENARLSIPIDGSAVLTEADVATYNGAVIDYSINNIPTDYDLAQNYPNPFNPSTTIALSLPVESDWTVDIYNVTGQLVNQFSGHSAAGTVLVEWDGTDRAGQAVASGIYLYKATADAFTATKKMVLMK